MISISADSVEDAIAQVKAEAADREIDVLVAFEGIPKLAAS